MAIRKQKNGSWMAGIKLDAVTRYRKCFKTRKEAARFESFIRTKHTKGEADEWNPAKADKRRLSELIELWYTQHGAHLAKPQDRHSTLKRMCKAFNNPIAKRLSPAAFLEYRHKQFEAGVSPKTLNNHLGYLNALYGYLHKTDQINYSSPVAKVQPIKLKERELTFLTLDQCHNLLDRCKESGSRSLYMVVRICLETGCRWNEAQKLKLTQIGHQRITFTDTKSGKNRTVPISPELEADIRAYTPTGQGNLLFAKATKHFFQTLKKCSFTLPKGQAAHVLRHTFASHFIMNGGDILTLQRLLGHSTVTLTMRYSHLAPEHLQDAVKYRPKLTKI